jgi:hypothetical protein
VEQAVAAEPQCEVVVEEAVELPEAEVDSAQVDAVAAVDSAVVVDSREAEVVAFHEEVHRGVSVAEAVVRRMQPQWKRAHIDGWMSGISIRSCGVLEF